MTVTTDLSTHSLELSRRLPVPLERVFQCWTDGEVLARWFSPSAEYDVIVHHLEARTGGTYRIEMRHVSGKSHVVAGMYREVAPPSRVVFTWSWESDDRPEETVVTIALRPEGEGTELRLRHELFSAEPASCWYCFWARLSWACAWS